MENKNIDALGSDIVNIMRAYKKELEETHGPEIAWEIFIKIFYLSCMDPRVIRAEAEAFRNYMDNL